MALVYKNKRLIGKCILFAYIGSVFLKELCKTNNVKCKIEVKRFIINDIDTAYSPYHYYIEIKFVSNKKLIIDNDDCYDYQYYKEQFILEKIEKIGAREINYVVKKVVKENKDSELINIIRATAFCHYVNFKEM